MVWVTTSRLEIDLPLRFETVQLAIYLRPTRAAAKSSTKQRRLSDANFDQWRTASGSQGSEPMKGGYEVTCYTLKPRPPSLKQTKNRHMHACIPCRPFPNKREEGCTDSTAFSPSTRARRWSGTASKHPFPNLAKCDIPGRRPQIVPPFWIIHSSCPLFPWSVLRGRHESRLELTTTVTH